MEKQVANLLNAVAMEWWTKREVLLFPWLVLGFSRLNIWFCKMIYIQTRDLTIYFVHTIRLKAYDIVVICEPSTIQQDNSVSCQSLAVLIIYISCQTTFFFLRIKRFFHKYRLKKRVDPSIHSLIQSTSYLDLGLDWIRTQLYN